jgi:hypothetical protein
MSRLAMLWLFSLVVVGVLASAVTAQVARPAQQTVLSGADLGFRIEGTDSKGRPFGTLVVRMNGEWVATSETMKPASIQ